MVDWLCWLTSFAARIRSSCQTCAKNHAAGMGEATGSKSSLNVLVFTVRQAAGWLSGWLLVKEKSLPIGRNTQPPPSPQSPCAISYFPVIHHVKLHKSEESHHRRHASQFTFHTSFICGERRRRSKAKSIRFIFRESCSSALAS